jgi:hypothetical protein
VTLDLLVDATDLEQWADRRDAQADLPELVRSLVLATTPRLTRLSMRAGEGVGLPGWDGVVEAEEGHAFVPQGLSCWEFSTAGNVARKLEADYRKRCGDPRGVDPARATLVFVTPRRFPRKDRWIEERRREGRWRDVRAYDADDLVAWLTCAPAVHTQLSIRLGKRPQDVEDLQTFWRDWSTSTRPPLPPALVLAGRGDVVRKIHEWVGGAAAALALQADSRAEALAVFAAALQELPAAARDRAFSRALAVRSQAAWDQLLGSRARLLLVRDFDDREIGIRGALQAGHHVLIPLDRSDTNYGGAVLVPPLSRDDVAKTLADLGFTQEQARDLAGLARRSLSAFRRKLAVSPAVQQPIWARPDQGSSLIPALLAGAWRDDSEGDREALAEFAGRPYEGFAEALRRWLYEPEPPIRRTGEAWYLVSREEAWLLLGRYLTRDHLERFARVALEVLGTPDPRFDLPPDQRWMAGALGRAPRWSTLLRDGLAEGLAVLGTRGQEVPADAAIRPADHARRIVHDLLQRANADWRLWASLSPVLPLLAEAAPDEFLQAVDEGVRGDSPVLLRLFTDQGAGLFASSPHTGLLRALETLAWNPEHLGYAARLLARLARLDPGGRLRNRPQASLRAIFLLRLPQTGADLDQRLRVLDSLRQSEPDGAWRLMVDLLPKRFDAGNYTAKPRWREWCPDQPPGVTWGEHGRAVREVIARVLEDARSSGARWAEVIAALPEFPLAEQDAAVERLQRLDLDGLAREDRAAVWEALRRLVAKHRTFADADWALPPERVARVESLLPRFEPGEPSVRYGWLFEDAPDLPEGHSRKWEPPYQEALQRARAEAVQRIYESGELEALLAFAGEVRRPDEVGATLARTGLAAALEDELLGTSLASANAARARFAAGFVRGRIATAGVPWAEAKLVGKGPRWTAAQRAEVLLCLPNVPDTWDLAAGLGEETERTYWARNWPYGIGRAHAERAARSFLKHGRPYAAAELLAREENPPAPLVADALEAVLQAPPGSDQPTSFFIHKLPHLLARLAASQVVDESRVARLEWAFLPLLGHDWSPQTLHRELARNPEFFVEIVSLVFRGQGEEPREVSEEDQARAERGFRLLDAWRTLPGTTGSAEIDAAQLRAWVDHARNLLRSCARLDIGDRIIGQTLSGSPPGPDGAWPHPAVRDLIEDVASADLEKGVVIGVHGNRGGAWRNLLEGGAQEWQSADTYDRHARAVADRWPRTAALLRGLADTYRNQAEREDQRARLREDLDRWI